MKSNKLNLVAAIAYTFLLYQEGIGINVLILNLILIATQFWINPKAFKETSTKWLTIAALFSATAALVNGHLLSVLANILSLIFLSISMAVPKLSIMGYLLQGLFAYSASPFAKLSKMFDKEMPEATETNVETQTASQQVNYKLIIVFSSIIFIIFFGIYRNMSVGFDVFLKQINLNFISFPVILHYLVGSILLGTYFTPILLKHLADKELSMGNLQEFTDFKSYHILGITVTEATEKMLAKVVFIGLNLLLVLVNLVDTYYLSMKIMPEGVSFSEYVHQGVDALIWSIILAISIILWVFRGSQSFSENKNIQALSYVWISLNIWLVFTAAFRNHLYIHEADLYTYKRIGVYFFLFCATAGLLLTYVKIRYKLSNYFLVQTNTLLWFALLITSTAVNWDRLIANHHVAHALVKNRVADTNYLYKLSRAAYPAIATYSERTMSTFKHPVTGEILETYTDAHYLYQEINDHLTNKSWKSFNLSNRQIVDELHAIINSK
jgi:hypothetical protein